MNQMDDKDIGYNTQCMLYMITIDLISFICETKNMQIETWIYIYSAKDAKNMAIKSYLQIILTSGRSINSS